MQIIEALKGSIGRVGIKEVARRTGLSPSTVSRVSSGQISPSLEVAEKISDAVGFRLELHPDNIVSQAPRLKFVIDLVGRLRNELKSFGVKHLVIFGSVARGKDRAESDIDLFLDFGKTKPRATNLLAAEGLILEAFGQNKVDVVSGLDSPKGQRLKVQIEKDGVYVF